MNWGQVVLGTGGIKLGCRKKENTGRNELGTFGGQDGNLVQWKFPEINKGDSLEDS